MTQPFGPFTVEGTPARELILASVPFGGYNGTVDNHFGEILRTARQAKNRTMGDIARLLGVSVPFISDVEHNRRPPLSHERIERVAAFLEVDATELHLAAARFKGSVELDTNSDRRQQAAAALARGWTDYSDAELDQIRLFAEQMRLKRTRG